MLSSLAAIDETVHLEDARLRNLRITLTYHEIELEMSPAIGDDNVRWCAFAVWASRTAGRFIREELPTFGSLCFDDASPALRRVRLLLKQATARVPFGAVAYDLLVGPLEDMMGELADDVAAGNLKVFAELAPLFRRFIDLLQASPGFDTAEIDAFVAGLRPGPVEAEGQELLIRAFRLYYQAKYESSPRTKAQMILLANNLVGLHEQSRLQGPIAASLTTPLEMRMLSSLVARAQAHIPVALHRPARRVIERSMRRVLHHVEMGWRRWATEVLMTLKLPDLMLDLGSDIPPYAPGPPSPSDLARLDHAELVELMRRMDRSQGNLVGSGANDWVDLSDRMSTIINLFRSRQQHRALWKPPFTQDQIDDIHRGVMPVGSMS